MTHHFEEVITTRERIRELYGTSGRIAASKVIDRIDDVCRRFIAASPFVMVATRGRDGRLDLSPKGDQPGFVSILDEKTLAIPDRPGNNRLDTFENLLVHPEVGLFFIVPGVGNTLRVSGKARIVRDGKLQKAMEANGKIPSLALVVSIEEIFSHCPKCMIRSNLWKAEQWPSRVGVPTHAEALATHAALGESETTMQERIDTDILNRLY